MNAFNILLVQNNPVWERPEVNRALLEKTILENKRSIELILLPEMFSTGFTLNTTLAEPMDGATVTWMGQMARLTGAVVAGTLQIIERDQVFNRMIWYSPEGKIHSYDKRHLFRMGLEQENFSKGQEQCIINHHNWNIKPLICYDLRFPVWSRNTNNAYDLLIYFANWPSVRREAYLTLLKARAIENLCYVIGINRTGTDGNDIHYQGDTVVVDPKGKCLLGPLPSEEITESIELSLSELYEFRQKFPAWLDGDHFSIMAD